MLPDLFAEVMKISPYYADDVKLLHVRVDRGTIEDFGDHEDVPAEEIATERSASAEAAAGYEGIGR